jgi:hypothetical protein
MSYQDMPLKEEIRRCLFAHGGKAHPENISRWIVQDRLDRSLAGNMKPKTIQKLKWIKTVMAGMDDIEVVEVGGRHYRQFKKQGKLTRVKQWIYQRKALLSSTIKDMRQKLRTLTLRF